MGAANKYKDLYADAQQNPTDSKKDKVEVEVLRKAIQQKLKKDPNLSKKAALIIEQMINQQPKK